MFGYIIMLSKKYDNGTFNNNIYLLFKVQYPMYIEVRVQF